MEKGKQEIQIQFAQDIIDFLCHCYTLRESREPDFEEAYFKVKNLTKVLEFCHSHGNGRAYGVLGQMEQFGVRYTG